jgi:hypothetical protein
VIDDPNFISLAVDLNYFAQAGNSISGGTTFKNLKIQVDESAANPLL